MKWYTSTNPEEDRQGLVIDEETGQSVAITYDPKHAQLIAAAPELLAGIVKAEKMLAEANYAFYVTGKRKALESALNESKTLLIELRAVVAKAQG